MLQQKRCKICIGLSPCPNDTFIFDALLYKKIDTKNIDFSFYMDDVEQLNNKVIQEELDICKISCGVYHLVSRYYNILKTGGAIGSDVGPLLVVKDIKSVEQRNDFSVALPGVYTTAHLIFQYFFPTPRKKIFMPFHQIEDAVLTGAADAGVLIHENCFTYKKNGLKLMMNLGKQWEEVFKSPIPLGCVVAHKRLKKSIVLQVEQLIKESIWTIRILLQRLLAGCQLTVVQRNCLLL